MLSSWRPRLRLRRSPRSQAVAESDPGIREIERKVLLEHFAAAVKELKGVEEALMNATTPEQKAVASKVAEKHRKWVDELKARLAQAEPGDDPKTAAMTKKLDAIVIRYSAFRDATLSEVVHHLINRGKEADPDKTGVPIRFSLMDKEDESPITFHLENATLHLLLQVVAEQAGLTLDIGEEIVSLRKQTGSQAEPGQLVQPAVQVDEDVAFFEKKYQKKITGVKPKGEYSDPDQFYSAIGEAVGHSRDRLEGGGGEVRMEEGRRQAHVHHAERRTYGGRRAGDMGRHVHPVQDQPGDRKARPGHRGAGDGAGRL